MRSIILKQTPRQTDGIIPRKEANVGYANSGINHNISASYDFGAMSVYGGIETKRSIDKLISQRGDKLERDAEYKAMQVMQAPDNNIDKNCYKNLNDNNDKSFLTDSSTCQPLDGVTRAFMEPRFGYNFSKVRIHTDTNAAASAKAINALAFTVGNDITFDTDRYNQCGNSRRLIAHELAHVVQNNNISDRKTIRRYESPEHQDLGDKYQEQLFDFVQTEEGAKWAKARGIDPLKLVRDMNQDPVYKTKKIKVRKDLELTPGDIIALMGDFYGTWQELRDAPKKEIDEILMTMRQERAGVLKDANSSYEKVTGGRYTKLAKINTKHFAPVNRQAWKTMHLEAMSKASKAGKDNNEDLFQEALLIDTAGGHFLTDSFASGHLFDSSKVTIAITRYLKENPIRTENPEMQSVAGALDMADLASSLVLKNIHDRMNKEGFDMTNGKGMTWKTYGDNNLKNTSETQRIAAYAIFLSRQQIINAKKGEESDPDEVYNLLPNDKTIEQATDRAYAYIPDAVKEITPLIKRNLGMLDTVHPPIYLGGPILPFLGKTILGNISDPSRPRELQDYEERKLKDPSTPYPSPFRFELRFGK